MHEGDPTVGATVEQVGPRLRRARERRDVSLADLTRSTGISTSTLSRLETGRRRPSLELLVPITAALGITLDEVVTAPVVADRPPAERTPRADRHGRVVTPLSTRPGRLRASTLLIPAHDMEPHPITHPGHVWLLVLHGRLRLVLGERDLRLGEGEAAELDCSVPHWFGASGHGSVEVLSVFGEAGHRIRTRTRPF